MVKRAKKHAKKSGKASRTARKRPSGAHGGGGVIRVRIVREQAFPCHYTEDAVCRMLSLDPHRLEEYIETGFIKPDEALTTDGKGMRVFSAGDVRRIRRIRTLVEELGVNAAGVEIILNLLDRLDEIVMGQ